jgi:6-phosphogluconolactonase
MSSHRCYPCLPHKHTSRPNRSPSNFSLDPVGRFIFAAGSESGRLASYRINDETGALTPLATYEVGRRPMGMLAIRLGD